MLLYVQCNIDLVDWEHLASSAGAVVDRRVAADFAAVAAVQIVVAGVRIVVVEEPDIQLCVQSHSQYQRI